MSEEGPGTPTAVDWNRDSIPRGGASESGQGWPGPISPRTASEPGWFARHEHRDFPIHLQPVANHLAEAPIRKGIAAGKACFTFCFPSHPPQSRNVRDVLALAHPSMLVTQHQRSRNSRGFLRWLGHSLIHSPTTSLPHTHKQSHSNRQESPSSSTGQHYRSVTSMVRICSLHQHTLPSLGSSISITHLAAASPARKLLPTFGQKSASWPGRELPPGSELLNTDSFYLSRSEMPTRKSDAASDGPAVV